MTRLSMAVFQFWFVVKPSGQSNHVWSQPVSDQWWPSDGICSDLDAGQGPIWYPTSIWYRTSIQHLHHQWWFTSLIYFVSFIIHKIAAVVPKIQCIAMGPLGKWGCFKSLLALHCSAADIGTPVEWVWYRRWYWYCSWMSLVLTLVLVLERY